MEVLDAEEPPRLPDLCHTANRSRTRFRHRLALVADDLADLRRQLEETASGPGSAIAESPDKPPPVVFLFSGQGAQYAGMAAELYRSQPVFRGVIDRCAEILRGRLEHGLVDLLLADPGGDERIRQTQFTQPLLFAVECALAAFWRSLGVRPAAVLGHSLGEIAAACVAGVFELEPALRFVAARAEAMSLAPGDGAMAAVFAPAGEVRGGLSKPTPEGWPWPPTTAPRTPSSPASARRSKPPSRRCGSAGSEPSAWPSRTPSTRR